MPTTLVYTVPSTNIIDFQARTMTVIVTLMTITLT